MSIQNRLAENNITQSDLARILGKGEITPKIRVRAHRIWHGLRPDDQEMALIYDATNGDVDGNTVYNLPSTKHKKTTPN